MSTFTFAFWQADLFGKIVFAALFFLSIISWALFLHKYWIFRQVIHHSKLFRESVEKQLSSLLSIPTEALPKPTHREIPFPFPLLYLTVKKKTQEILDKNNYFSQLSRGKSNTLSVADIDLIISHAQTIALKQKELMERNLYILPLVVTLAPFLGLLGTVWGILVTFSGLGKGGDILSNSTVIAGLSTALATTVLGLVIAIPALIAYSYLKSTSKDFQVQMHDFSHQLVSTIELQYRSVEGA